MIEEYTLRKLKSSDLFVFVSLLKNIGFKEFKSVFESESVKNTIAKMQGGAADNLATSVGISVAIEVGGIILENIPNCEKDLYTILASLSGMKEKDIKELSPATFAQMIIDVIQKEEFKDFFKVVLKFFK